MEVKNYPKNKNPIQQQPKFKPSKCPSCIKINWLELFKGCYCQNCDYDFTKQKHQIDGKVFRHDHYFLTRLPYANKMMKENWMNMVNTT